MIWESNPGLPDVARMATENFTTKPITRVYTFALLFAIKKVEFVFSRTYTALPTCNSLDIFIACVCKRDGCKLHQEQTYIS